MPVSFGACRPSATAAGGRRHRGSPSRRLEVTRPEYPGRPGSLAQFRFSLRAKGCPAPEPEFPARRRPRRCLGDLGCTNRARTTRIWAAPAIIRSRLGRRHRRRGRRTSGSPDPGAAPAGRRPASAGGGDSPTRGRRRVRAGWSGPPAQFRCGARGRRPPPRRAAPPLRSSGGAVRVHGPGSPSHRGRWPVRPSPAVRRPGTRTESARVVAVTDCRRRPATRWVSDFGRPPAPAARAEPAQRPPSRLWPRRRTRTAAPTWSPSRPQADSDPAGS